MAFIFDNKTGRFYDSSTKKTLGQLPQNYQEPEYDTIYNQARQNYNTLINTPDDSAFDMQHNANLVNGQTTTPVFSDDPAATAMYGQSTGMGADPRNMPTTPVVTEESVQTTPEYPTESTPEETPQQSQLNNIYDWLSTLFGGMNANSTQGLTESYLPSNTRNEVGQALSDKTLELLNTPYGYTSELQNAIFKNAIDQFNANREQDLYDLGNLGEKYGFNQGAGQGGQGKNTFETYLGKSALAEQGLITDLAQQFQDVIRQDRTDALQAGTDTAALLDSFTRGDFADQLALLDFNETRDTNNFNKTMQTLGFISDEEQRAFMNEQSISDREIDVYFKTREIEDANAQANYQMIFDATGLSANQVLTALSDSDSNEAEILRAAIEKPEGAALALAMMGLMMGQNINNNNDNNDNPLNPTEDNPLLIGTKKLWDVFSGGTEYAGFLKPFGDFIAVYGVYRTVSDTLKSRGVGDGIVDSMTTEQKPYVAWSYFNENNIGGASTVLNNMTPFEQLAFFNAMKNGDLSVSDAEGNKTALKSIILNDQAISALRSKGFLDAPYKFASDEHIQQIIDMLPNEESTPEDWYNYAKTAMLNGIKIDSGYFTKQGHSGISDYVPPISRGEYNNIMTELFTAGEITQDEFNNAMSYQTLWEDKLL